MYSSITADIICMSDLKNPHCIGGGGEEVGRGADCSRATGVEGPEGKSMKLKLLLLYSIHAIYREY